MTSSAEVRRWFPAVQPGHQAAARLFCLPHAGAGASVYFSWTRNLPPRLEVIPVQLPARAERHEESLPATFAALADGVCDALACFVDRPMALFGHSMGAMLAFEVARRLRARGLPQPAHLFASSMAAPQLQRRLSPLTQLDDEAFLNALVERFGLPSEDTAHRSLMQALLPQLRGDLALLEAHKYVEEPPLDCPTMASGGRDDQAVSMSELASWRAQTTAAFSQRMFPGSHFYLESVGPSLRKAIFARMASVTKEA